jgi:hypothetical protein
MEWLGHAVGQRVIQKKRFYGENRVMDEAQLGDKLRELVKEFGGAVDSQYGKLAMLAQQASESHKQLEKSVNNLQESLDYLRVCIKYQLFDLEATRRENEYLRKILEENNNQGPA